MSAARRILTAIAVSLLGLGLVYGPQACLVARDEQGHVDLNATADNVQLYRDDVATLLLLATPETQATLQSLLPEVDKVIAALRAAGAGGPIEGVLSAAKAAAAGAKSVIADLQAQGKYVGNWPLYVGGLEIVLRHLSAGELQRAAREAAR